MKTTYEISNKGIKGWWDSNLIEEIRKNRRLNCIRDYKPEFLDWYKDFFINKYNRHQEPMPPMNQGEIFQDFIYKAEND